MGAFFCPAFFHFYVFFVCTNSGACVYNGLMMINDNDFGIRGDKTRIVLVKGAVSADPAIWKK